MKRPFLLLVLPALLALPAVGDQPAAQPPVTDFLRVENTDTHARLQAGVTRYERDGVAVDLLGAVHIADAAYYDGLNERFKGYDALLFEMIGGEKLVDGRMPAPEGKPGDDPAMDLLGNIYAAMSKFLQLTDQKSRIDYGAPNFVHADLTLAEFTKLQAEKGESLLGFALAAGRQAQEDGRGGAEPDMQRLVQAFLTGNSGALKIELMNSLGEGDDLVASFAGDSVIVGDRNAKCLAVLDEQIKAGKTSLGIFYGAAHYPDMEARLVADGFRKTKHEWINAWEVARAKPAPAE